MSYSLVLKKTGEVIGLDDDEGASLVETWEQAKKPFVVRVGNDSFMSNEISRITKNKDDWLTSDIIERADRQLSYGSKCRGRYSIQNQVNLIIRSDYPHDWAKKIQDKGFREQIRAALLKSQPDGWCDYKAGTCFCNSQEAIDFKF